MSKTILANVDGFTPVIDSLVEEMGLMTAAVFGRIWRYCQMEDGVCKASLESIGKWIGVDKATVMRHAKVLCDNGYLKDLTPDLRNRPHVYADTGKAGISIQLSGVAHSKAKKQTVADSNATVAECNVGVAESQLNKVFKKEFKTPQVELTEKEKEQAGAMVMAMVENAKKVKYQNRDKLPEPYLYFADLYNSLTQQAPTKRDLMDWMSTFEEWKQKELQAEHIRAAFEYATRKDGGFPVGRPGSLTATAVGMKTRMIAATQQPQQYSGPKAHRL
jgi:hypothetical protein